MKHFIVTLQENRGYRMSMIESILTGQTEAEYLEEILRKEINLPELEIDVKKLT